MCLREMTHNMSVDADAQLRPLPSVAPVGRSCRSPVTSTLCRVTKLAQRQDCACGWRQAAIPINDNRHHISDEIHVLHFRWWTSRRVLDHGVCIAVEAVVPGGPAPPSCWRAVIVRGVAWFRQTAFMQGPVKAHPPHNMPVNTDALRPAPAARAPGARRRLLSRYTLEPVRR